MSKLNHARGVIVVLLAFNVAAMIFFGMSIAIGRHQEAGTTAKDAAQPALLADTPSFEIKGSDSSPEHVDTAKGEAAEIGQFRVKCTRQLLRRGATLSSTLQMTQALVDLLALTDHERLLLQSNFDWVLERLRDLELSNSSLVTEEDGDQVIRIEPLSGRISALISEIESRATEIIGEERARLLADTVKCEPELFRAAHQVRKVAIVENPFGQVMGQGHTVLEERVFDETGQHVSGLRMPLRDTEDPEMWGALQKRYMPLLRNYW